MEEYINELMSEYSEVLQLNDKNKAKSKALLMSEKLMPAKIDANSTVNDFIETILHYYFQNFYDKEAFIENNKINRALIECTLKNERDILLHSPELYDFKDIEEKLLFGYWSYISLDQIKIFFTLCIIHSRKNDKGKISIGVELALNIFLSKMIRCFGINPGDLGKYIDLACFKDEIVMINFNEAKYFNEIDQNFLKFCQNYTKNPEYDYLAQLHNIEYGSIADNLKDHDKEIAMNAYMETYYQIRDENIYFMEIKPKYEHLISFHGITLFTNKIIIPELKVKKSEEYEKLWYTFVLIHEMCHLHRHKISGYDVEKYTPKKWLCEAGKNIELELFGKVCEVPDTIVNNLQELGMMDFSHKKKVKFAPLGCYVGDPTIIVERFEKFFKDNEAKNK